MLLDNIDTDDWLYVHFNELVEVSKTSQMGKVVPVIATYKDENDYGVPKLASLIDVGEDNLPELFAYHAASGKLVSFPGLLDEIKTKMPKETLLWWAKTMMTMDLSYQASQKKEQADQHTEL